MVTIQYAKLQHRFKDDYAYIKSQTNQINRTEANIKKVEVYLDQDNTHIPKTTKGP